MRKVLFFLIIIVVFSVSCDKVKENSGKLILNFNFVVDGQPLKLDTLMYTNKAENNYLVSDLQMLVSRLYLLRSDGEEFIFNNPNFVHYIDFADKSTYSWKIEDMPSGVYNAIGFTFGLDSTINITGTFKNPPICDMMWPSNLGGGYHYLKLNCKWKSRYYEDVLLPFNFHLGIGQIYKRSSISDTLFVDNSLPLTFDVDYEIKSEYNNQFDITVNINHWFDTPCLIDFDEYIDVAIMQSQDVQAMAKENGKNVFSLRKNNESH